MERYIFIIVLLACCLWPVRCYSSGKVTIWHRNTKKARSKAPLHSLSPLTGSASRRAMKSSVRHHVVFSITGGFMQRYWTLTTRPIGFSNLYMVWLLWVDMLKSRYGMNNGLHRLWWCLNQLNTVVYSQAPGSFHSIHWVYVTSQRGWRKQSSGILHCNKWRGPATHLQRTTCESIPTETV